MKIVINDCYGGYGLSKKAIKEIYERKGQQVFFYSDDDGKNHKIENLESGQFFFCVVSKDLGDETTDKLINEFFIDADDIPRNDPDLIAIVEKLEEKANGEYSKLKIVEIPDDVEWEINTYDGMETVEEKHRSWS